MQFIEFQWKSHSSMRDYGWYYCIQHWLRLNIKLEAIQELVPQNAVRFKTKPFVEIYIFLFWVSQRIKSLINSYLWYSNHPKMPSNPLLKPSTKWWKLILDLQECNFSHLENQQMSIFSYLSVQIFDYIVMILFPHGKGV